MELTTRISRLGAGLAAAATITVLAVAPGAAAQVPGGPSTDPPTRPEPVPQQPSPPVAQPQPEPSPDPGPKPQSPPVGTPAPAPKPQGPKGPKGKSSKKADAKKLAKELEKRLAGAFGFQYAIAQQGKLKVADGVGTARSKADNDGVRLDMQPTMRWELASLTKNVTAAATLKLLRMNGRSVEDSIDEFLPPSWTRGPGFEEKAVTFRHLLTHTSGIDQMLTAQPKDVLQENKVGNHYTGARWVVGQGTKPNSAYAYKNMNYVLLSVLNARMWRAVNGPLKVPSMPQLPGIEVTSTSYGIYGLDFFNKQLMGPIGIKGVTCLASANEKAGFNYPANPTQQTKGALGAWPVLNCASNAGLRLSSIEVVRWLSHLRYGSVMHPDDVATMDSLFAGWDPRVDYVGGRGHGGDFTGTNQVHTCGATFPDGTAVSVIVNSPLPAGSDYQCVAIRKAWQAAKSSRHTADVVPGRVTRGAWPAPSV